MSEQTHAAEEVLTSTAYLKHHLQNMVFGKLPAGYERHDGSVLAQDAWTLATSPEEAVDMGFWSLNVDSMGWSIGLGLIFVLIFRKVAKSMTLGVPGGLQNVVEILVEFADTSVRETFHGRSHPAVAPLALTIFCWILLMNTMDLVPVDLLPLLAQKLSGNPHLYFKVVPTTDPNVTFGFSLSVFALIIYYSIRIKGLGGFIGELALHPFENGCCRPICSWKGSASWPGRYRSHCGCSATFMPVNCCFCWWRCWVISSFPRISSGRSFTCWSSLCRLIFS